MTSLVNGLRQKAVCERLGISRVTLWRMVNEGRFPQPIQISERIKIWPEAELNAWVDLRRGIR